MSDSGRDSTSWSNERWRALSRLLLMTVMFPAVALAGPPFLTDDPEPTETGHWEVYLRQSESRGRGQDFEGSFGAELNYGAAKNLQLTLGLPVA